MGILGRLFGGRHGTGGRKCAICGAREGELRKAAYNDERRVGWVAGSTCRNCGFICDDHPAKVVRTGGGNMHGACPRCGEAWS